MTDAFDLQGRWWLPEHEDHKVFGTFRWDPSTGGTLEVQGELRPVVWKDNVLPDGSVQKYRDHPSRAEKQNPIIYGQAEHRAYTLLNAFSISVHEFDMDDSIEKLHVNRLMSGAWFDGDDPEIDRVVIDVRHLTSWVNQTGLTTEHPRHDDADDDRFSMVIARSLPSLRTDHGQTSVRFGQSLSEEGDHIHELGIRQRWSLSLVHPEPRPLTLFMDTASDIQDLVSIAVGQTADFEDVRLQHPSLPKLSMAGNPLGNWREDITYYARWSNRSASSDPVKRHDMYFTLDDFGGVDGVGRWLNVAERYRTELSRAMATRYSASMFLEDRIMNLSAALDSFDKVRRSTGDQKVDYVDRITYCIDLAGEPFSNLIGQNPREWAKSVKEARHDLAHHRERFRRDGSVGEHLQSEQLFWLFVMCMMRLADAPTAVFESIGNHAQVRWLTEQSAQR